MLAVKDSEYKCSLGEQMLKKAKDEIKEDPNSRLIEVKTLRSRIEKVPGLKPRTDITFVLAFLRARKFEQERAFELIKSFYQIRKNDPEIFDDLKPCRVKHVIEDGIVEVLKHRDNNGSRVVIIRPGKWNPDRYSMFEMHKTLFLTLYKLAQEEETQVNGIHIINNLDNIAWAQAKHLTPGVAKRMMAIMQNVLPLRLRRFDYCNEPTFFDIIFPIIRQFMKEKLVKRIHLNGSEYKGLHTTINPDFLPTDLGGKLEPFSNKEWVEEFFKSDPFFEDDNKFGFVNMTLENNKKAASKEDAGMSGLGGTFKKLDV